MTSHSASEKYHQLNLQISEDLFQGKCITRAYQNASLALYDITMGLQQYLSHKSHLGIARNGSSLIESLMPFWLRQSAPMQYKTEQQSWIEYIETLNPDTNFVVWASENEITGEILLSDQDILDIHERLSKKRIFSIQISHRFTSMPILPSYAIQVVRKSIFADHICIVTMSDKMKASSLIGSFQNINSGLANTFNQFPNMSVVEKIETELSDPSILYFKQYAMAPARLPDRIVFMLKNMNASALKTDLNLPESQCFAPSSLPFWLLDMWKNWWKDGEKEMILRGLLVVSIDAFISDSQLPHQIHLSVDKIRRLGHWNVLPSGQ